MIQLDNLQVFLCVARTGSLVAAAKELDVNQTTVYRRLRSYEQDLGVRLFERGEQGHSLTEAGKDVFATGERVESEMLDMRRRLDSKSFDLSGTIKVTTTQVIADRLLLPYLPGFSQVYPDITVEILTSRARLDLTKREADIALRSTLTPPTGLIASPLIEHVWHLCASNDYISQHGQPESIHDFGQHKFVLGTEELGDFVYMQWLREHVPQTNIAMQCNSVSSILNAVMAGAGISLLPHYIVDPAIRPIGIEIPEMPSKVFMLIHPEMAKNPRAKAFSEYIHEACEAHHSDLRQFSTT